MGQHQFDPIRRRHPQVSGLRVQWAAVVAGLCPLPVHQERLADMTERHFLGIAERIDCRVLARALARPRAQQGGEGGDAGVEIGHVRQGTTWNSHLAAGSCPQV